METQLGNMATRTHPVNWVTQDASRNETTRTRDHLAVDELAILRNTELDEAIENNDTQIKEHNEQWQRDYCERTDFHSSPPSRGQTWLGKRKERVHLVLMIIAFVAEGLNAGFNLSGMRMPLALLFLVGVLLIILVAASGHRYYTRQEETKGQPIGTRLGVLVGWFILFAGMCSIMGALTYYRMNRLETGTLLEEMQFENLGQQEPGELHLWPLLLGIGSFCLSWIVGFLTYEWNRLYSKWAPPHSWYKTLDKLREHLAELRADWEKLPTQHLVWHASVEKRFQDQCGKLVRKVTRREWWYTKFHTDEYPGRIALNDIKVMPWDHCTFGRKPAGQRSPLGASRLLPTARAGFMSMLIIFAQPVLEMSSNVWATNIKGGQLAEYHSHDENVLEKDKEERPIQLVVLVDVSKSCYNKLKSVGLGARVLWPLIRVVGEKGRIVLVPIDGSMRVNATLLYSAILPESEGIYGDKVAAARLYVATILTQKLDSLLNLRDSSFRNWTEIIYSIRFAAEKIDNQYRTVVCLASDMREDSPLLSMERKPFQPEKALKRIEEQGLLANLKGSEILVVTPFVQSNETDLEVLRRQFWQAYFERCSAGSVRWFGPDFTSFEQHVKQHYGKP